MLKRLLVAGLMTGLALPALAQSNANPANANAASPGGFLAQMPADGMRLSQLRGVDVIGSDITRVGEVEDVLVSRDGRRAGVLIDVGGFLGIGGKTVAVPFEAMLWNFEASPTDGPSSSNTGTRAEGGGLQTQMAASNDPSSPGVNTTGAVNAPARAGGSSGSGIPGGTGAGAVTPGTGGADAAGGPGPLTPMARGSGTETAGRTGMEAAMGGAPATGPATIPVTGGRAPERAVLRMTKQQLQDAPEWGGAR